MHLLCEFKSFYWYNLAANQGHAQAQFNLAEMYAKGLGVEMDKNKALKWHSKSADQGYSDAIMKIHSEIPKISIKNP